MLLFSCDLFFLLIQFLKGKINRHVTIITVVGYHLRTSQMCFHQGLGTLARPNTVELSRQTIGYHSFVLLVFPCASDSNLGECALHYVGELPSLERACAKIENNTRDLSMRNNPFFWALKYRNPVSFFHLPNNSIVSLINREENSRELEYLCQLKWKPVLFSYWIETAKLGKIRHVPEFFGLIT